MYIKLTVSATQPVIKFTYSSSSVYVRMTTPSPTYIKVGSNDAGGGGASDSALTLIQYVRNQTGATVTKGTVVYISGATGNTATISKAIATTDGTSAQTLGLIKDDIANNGFGYVVVFGRVSGLNTQSLNEGEQLYLSPTVAGGYTTTKPYAPYHLVYVGIVTRSHPTQGSIEVRVQNGYELDEIHDVYAQNPQNGDVLQYVSSTGLWTTTNSIDFGSW
jgi:ribosomal protein L35AE/L33A